MQPTKDKELKMLRPKQLFSLSRAAVEEWQTIREDYFDEEKKKELKLSPELKAFLDNHKIAPLLTTMSKSKFISFISFPISPLGNMKFTIEDNNIFDILKHNMEYCKDN